jgi:hypothetical protein
MMENVPVENVGGEAQGLVKIHPYENMHTVCLCMVPSYSTGTYVGTYEVVVVVVGE